MNEYLFSKCKVVGGIGETGGHPLLEGSDGKDGGTGDIFEDIAQQFLGGTSAGGDHSVVVAVDEIDGGHVPQATCRRHNVIKDGRRLVGFQEETMGADRQRLWNRVLQQSTRCLLQSSGRVSHFRVVNLGKFDSPSLWSESD